MKQIWAIADLHLCLNCPDKTMEDFGHRWENYIQRIETNWKQLVAPDDLVLVAGDISWALKTDEVKADLDWIGKLPGQKIMIRGNHDYWWKSLTQIRAVLPSNIHLIQNDAINYPQLAIAGSRLWDTLEFNNLEIIDFKENPRANPNAIPLTSETNEKIFLKELHRLELSLSQMNPEAKLKIALTHYPPISYDLKPSKVHALLVKYNVDYCVFGHMHNLKENLPPLFGEKDGVHYLFTAADYLQFVPQKVATIAT